MGHRLDIYEKINYRQPRRYGADKTHNTSHQNATESHSLYPDTEFRLRQKGVPSTYQQLASKHRAEADRLFDEANKERENGPLEESDFEGFGPFHAETEKFRQLENEMYRQMKLAELAEASENFGYDIYHSRKDDTNDKFHKRGRLPVAGYPTEELIELLTGPEWKRSDENKFLRDWSDNWGNNILSELHRRYSKTKDPAIKEAITKYYKGNK